MVAPGRTSTTDTPLSQHYPPVSTPYNTLPAEVPMKRNRTDWVVLLCGAFGPSLSAAELPADYFKLMEAEVQRLQSETDRKTNPGAMFAAAVLYAKQHPANPSFHDRKKLE